MQTDLNVQQESMALACDLTALNPEQRARHESLWAQISAARQEIRELPDGFAFRYVNDPAMLLTLAELISLEHLCCPFFTLAVELEAGRGPLWFKITGSEDVKGFVQAALSSG